MSDAQQFRGRRELDGARRGATLSDRVAFVRDLAEGLAGAVEQAEIAKVVRTDMRRGLGVQSVILNVVSEDGAMLETLVADGVAGPTKSLLETPIPLGADTPALAALKKGEPLLWPTLAVRNREFPEYADFASTSRSWAVLPLIAEGNPIGCLSLGWSEPRRFGRVETAFLQLVALQCALAVDRARIDRLRRAERDTLELLSEGTRLMVSALEPAAIVDSLVHLAVPRLAPWCAVYVAEEGVLRRVAIEIEGDARLADSLRGLADITVDAQTPVAVTYRSGIARVVHPINPEQVRALYPEPFATRMLEYGSTWTGLVVPVRASGSVIGVMSLVSTTWGPTPPDQVIFAAEGLAARAGVALTNARRYQDERETAAMLMEAFLPAELPDIRGYEVAARYLPAGSKVAGDWYDVVRIGPGRYLVGIGDAGGHGIRAAALMGQLRNCARGLAMTGHSPAAVIDALHLITAEDDRDSFATAAYGILDLDRNAVEWASAGHLPALQYTKGSARYVMQSPSPPLGWPAGKISEWETAWKPGHGVVLFTDGLVERRDRDIQTGLDELRKLVASNARLSAKRLSGVIVDRLAQDPEDDCCVVVLRRR